MARYGQGTVDRNQELEGERTMAELGTRSTLKSLSKEESRDRLEEGSLLAAALVAALVEYRRHTERRNGHTNSMGESTNWRVMARMEQLARRAPRR